MESSVIAHIGAASVQGSIYCCVVWAACIALRRLPAVWKSWLWRSVSLKFLLAAGVAVTLPVVLSQGQETSAGPMTRVTHAVLNALPSATPERVAPAAPERTAQPAAAAVSHAPYAIGPTEILAAVWAVGASGLLIRLALGLRTTRSLLQRTDPFFSEAAQPAIDVLLEQAKCDSRVRIRALDGLTAPALFGMFTSTIVLPAESQGAEQDRLSSAIAHELAHLKRRDALWILLAELVKAAFWFVPFAWIACREQRVEAEIAADELARSWTASSPKNYASHLLAWVDTNRIPSVSVDAAPGVLLATHELTRRMKAMSFKPYNHQSTVACVAVLAVPLVLGLAPVKLVSVLGQKLAWSQYHGDPQNTGRGPGSGASGVKAWTFATHGWIDCSPAIGPDGTIYAGSEDGNEYAIDSKTGQEKWAFLTGDRTVAAPAENGGSVTGAAAIGADGTVYVASQDQSLYALNPKTGAKKWSFQTGGYIASGPAIGTDGSLIFGSQTGIVYALNGKTGAQKWTFTTSSEVYTTPAVGIDGTVYVGSSDKRLYALNGVTGKQNWSFQGEDKMGSPAVGADGTVYVSGGNNLYAVDGTNGNLKWTAHCSGKVDDPTIASDGTIYVGAGKEVIALNSADGAKKWSFAAGDVVNSPTIASDGTIYVGSSDRNLYALDGTTGAKKWSVTLADKVLNSPSISPSGTIYVGCADLRLYAIR